MGVINVTKDILFGNNPFDFTVDGGFLVTLPKDCDISPKLEILKKVVKEGLFLVEVRHGCVYTYSVDYINSRYTSFDSRRSEPSKLLGLFRTPIAEGDIKVDISSTGSSVEELVLLWWVDSESEFYLCQDKKSVNRLVATVKLNS